MTVRFAPALLVAATLAAAALPLAGQAASPAQLAQQQKMKDCNATAKTQAMKGDARTAFMKTCLSKAGTPATASTSAPAMAATTPAPAAMPAPMSGPKPAVSPANRMKTCNAEAGTKTLKGDARKTFMATCLKAA